VVAVLLLLGFWIWSRRNPVSAANVNEASDSFSTRTLSSIERPPVLEQAAG
jgi:hypothetical protein